MHRSRLATIFIDFAPDSYERGIAFWSEALGKAVMPTDHEQYRWLRRPDFDANATVWDVGE